MTGFQIRSFQIRREDIEVQRPNLMDVLTAGNGHASWCACPECFPQAYLGTAREVKTMGLTKHGHGDILREPEETPEPKTAKADERRDERLERLDDENREADR